MSPPMSLKILLLGAAALLTACTSPPSQTPRNDYDLNTPLRYPQALLDLALNKGGLTIVRNDSRLGGAVDVRWGDAAEQGYDPITVPIMRGLNDYWVALIRPGEQTRFDAIKHWWDLSCLTGAALVTEPVGKVFQAHNVSTRILPTDTHPGEWLSKKKVDFVIIPAMEAAHWLARSNGDFVLEKRLAFNHHHPYQFQVKNDPKLSDYVRLGLVVAEKDGSFETLYRSHYQGLLDRLDLSARRIFRLPHHGQTGEQHIGSACRLLQ